MRQNDTTACFQLELVGARDVQLRDRVVLDVLDDNAAERDHVWLGHERDEEIAAFLVHIIRSDIELLHKRIHSSKGGIANKEDTKMSAFARV